MRPNEISLIFDTGLRGLVCLMRSLVLSDSVVCFVRTFLHINIFKIYFQWFDMWLEIWIWFYLLGWDQLRRGFQSAVEASRRRGWPRRKRKKKKRNSYTRTPTGGDREERRPLIDNGRSCDAYETQELLIFSDDNTDVMSSRLSSSTCFIEPLWNWCAATFCERLKYTTSTLKWTLISSQASQQLWRILTSDQSNLAKAQSCTECPERNRDSCQLQCSLDPKFPPQAGRGSVQPCLHCKAAWNRVTDRRDHRSL